MVLDITSVVFLACHAHGRVSSSIQREFLGKKSQVLAIGSHHENNKHKWDMDGALTICAMQSFAGGTKNSLARRQRAG